MRGFGRRGRSKAYQARGRGGRYVRNTPENTFGLHLPICPHCRGFNPHDVGTPRPEVCKQCGKPVKPEEWE